MRKQGAALDGAALRNTSRIRQAGLRAFDAHLARLPMRCTVAVERGGDPADHGRLPLRGQRRPCSRERTGFPFNADLAVVHTGRIRNRGNLKGCP